VKGLGPLVLAGLVGWAGALGAFPLPPPLETAHLLGRGLPAGTPPVPLADELFALGWSPSNAFAVLERRTRPLDPPQVFLRVIDLVDDRVLAEQEWEDWGPPEAQGAWWAGHEAAAEALFHHFGLVPIDNQLGLFPLILDNEFYTLVLRTDRAPADPAWIGSFEVVVQSTGRGLKSVLTGGDEVRWATVLGFIPSPFENRSALILAVQKAGWAGEKQPLRFVVTGLSLKAGFPKP